MKMLIHANEDSYVNTKNKMAAVDKLQKQNCVKEINAAGSRSSQKANGQHKKPVDFVPVVPVTAFGLKKPLPVKPGLPQTNSDIINEPIRDRLIHILAVRPYKKPELLLRLNREGISDEDKNRLILDLVQVAVLKKNSYNLADRMWSKVQDKWKYYSPEDAALVQKKKQSFLQSSESLPLNNQPSSSPDNINELKEGLPDIYPPVTKQRTSHFNQKSYNDVIPCVLPKKEPPKLCSSSVLPKKEPPKLYSSSESEYENINYPASTKRKRCRKIKSKHRGKNLSMKSSSTEDEIKSGNQSSTLRFSNKLILNNAKCEDILVVKASSPEDQRVPVPSLSLERKIKDANTVSLITNPELKNNNISTKFPSSGRIVNSSKELLLKSNSYGCKNNAVQQVSSALKSFAPVNKTSDVIQTSPPLIDSNSEISMQCSTQVPSLAGIPMACSDNQTLDLHEVLHSVEVPSMVSNLENCKQDTIQNSGSIKPLQSTGCKIKENPMQCNYDADQTMQIGSQILHSTASRMLHSNSSSESKVLPQNNPSTVSQMLCNNSSSKMQDSSQNALLTASRRLFCNASYEMKDSSQNHPLTASRTLFNNSSKEMQDSSQNHPSAASCRLSYNPDSKLEVTSQVPCSTECDATSYEMHPTPARIQSVHSSDACDYKKQYFKIASYEQRSLYAAHFNAEYPEYIELFHRLQYKCKELEFFENTLKSCREGTEEYNRVKKAASEVCKSCVPELNSVQRRDFLHEKLHHIRKLIIKYDLEQMEAS